MSVHLSDLEFDGMRLGALPAGRRAEAEAHLHACPRCAGRHEALSAEAAAFEADFDVRALARSALAAGTPTRRMRRPWPWLAVPALVAAAVVIVLLRPTPVAPPDAELRVKGAAAPLGVFVVGPDGPEALRGPIAPGARLRLRLDPGRAAYAAVIWRDERGEARILDQRAPPVAGWLLREVELDDATAPESVEVLLCDAPPDPRQATGDPPPSGCTRHVVPIEKRP